MRGLRKNCLTVVIGSVLSSGTPSAAHTIVDSLGGPLKSVDSYQVTCSDDGNGIPTKLVTQIKDFPPVAAPTLSVLTYKGTAAVSVSDLVDGDAVFSRKAANTGGVTGANGVFYLFVSKTAPGVESYQVEVHCMSVTSGLESHTGTDINQLQDR